MLGSGVSSVSSVESGGTWLARRPAPRGPLRNVQIDICIEINIAMDPKSELDKSLSTEGVKRDLDYVGKL